MTVPCTSCGGAGEFGAQCDCAARASSAKADVGKPRYSLLPWDVVALLVDVMEDGARKYVAHSWREVENGEIRYLDAAQRHVAAALRGEHINPESGLPHLAHAACSCMLSLAHREVSR